MRVTVESKGREFIIYGVHLISERLGPEDDFKRLAQASILRRHMLNDLQDGKYILIAGDFNDHRGQPPLRRARGLDDIFEDFIQTGYTSTVPSISRLSPSKVSMYVNMSPESEVKVISSPVLFKA